MSNVAYITGLWDITPLKNITQRNCIIIIQMKSVLSLRVYCNYIVYRFPIYHYIKY